MGELANLAIITGSSWLSGVNLYLTAAGLGVAHRFGWVVLPGELEILANPLVIALAIILYLIEFVADKVPYVDSTWDAVHTAIRPLGGAAMAYLATSDTGPMMQTAASLLGGTLAFDSHLMKASTRAMINTSPEPFSNSAASVTEDVAVVGSLWLIINHPLILLGIVVVFVLLSIWLVPKIFRFFKNVFSAIFGKKKEAESVTEKEEVDRGA